MGCRQRHLQQFQLYTQSSCLSHSKVWTPDNHSTWNGCVTDRDQNYDTINDAPIAGGTLFPAEQYSSCPASLMALSYDWTALQRQDRRHDSRPAIPTRRSACSWAGRSLTRRAVHASRPLDPNYKYKQVIILLTDGLNTAGPLVHQPVSIDTRQQMTCDNIKAAGITLYTVQVNTGGDPTSTLLQNCASDAEQVLPADVANQIITTFDQIGTALSNLRLAM